MRTLLSVTAVFSVVLSSVIVPTTSHAAGNQSCKGPAEYCEPFVVYCMEQNGNLVHLRTASRRWVRYNCEMPGLADANSPRLSSRLISSDNGGGVSVTEDENPGTVGPID